MDELNWSLISLVFGVFVAWNAFLVGIIRFFIIRSLGKIDEKFSGIERAIKEETQRRRELEEKFHAFEADLPNKFVQREDWIRFSTTIDHKMDKFYDLLVAKLS